MSCQLPWLFRRQANEPTHGCESRRSSCPSHPLESTNRRSRQVGRNHRNFSPRTGKIGVPSAMFRRTRVTGSLSPMSRCVVNLHAFDVRPYAKQIVCRLVCRRRTRTLLRNTQHKPTSGKTRQWHECSKTSRHDFSRDINAAET